jgi:hypothetical protein
MSKQIQRLVDVGLGRETVRGTAEAAADFWLPKIDFDFVPKVSVAVDNSGLGVIDARQGHALTQQYGEGSIGGIVYCNSFGTLLAMALGTWSSSTAVDSAYTHTFTRLNTNQHPSYTIYVKDENLDEGYPLGMLNQLTINAVVDDYIKFTAGFMSKTGATATQTPSYAATDYAFLPKNMAVKLATTTAALGTASETSLKSLRLTINKNVESWGELGSLDPSDVVNKEFAVEGEMTLVFDANTEREYVLDGTKMAMSIALTNSDNLLGTATYPSLSFELAPTSLEEFSRSGGAGDIELQTIRFAGNFGIADSKTISAILVNGTSAY